MKLLPAIALGSATLVSLLFHVCEREPNDTAEDATPLVGRGVRDGGVLAMGVLRKGDVDQFAFHAEAGEVVTIAVRDDTEGELADGVLAVFGPDGDEPLAEVDDVGRSLAPRVALPVESSGRHVLALTGFETDGEPHEQHFEYRIAVTRAAVGEERDRNGANDDPSRPDRAFLTRARLLPRGVAAVTGALTPGDVDHFLLPLAPRAVLTASVYDEGDGEFNDPLLRLLDRDGEPLAEDDDAGPGLLARIVYPVDGQRGPVVLALEGFDPSAGDADGDGHDESFDYRLVVSLEDKL